MALVILGIISSLLAIIIGLWKFFGRIAKEKRKLADEAQKEYEDAVKSGDTSRITAAFSRINRL